MGGGVWLGVRVSFWYMSSVKKGVSGDIMRLSMSSTWLVRGGSEG